MRLSDIFKINQFKEQITYLQQENASLEQVNANLRQANMDLTKKLDSLGTDDYFTLQENIKQLQQFYDTKLQELKRLSNEVVELAEKEEKLQKQINTNQKKIARMKELYQRIENVVTNYTNLEFRYEDCKIPQKEYEEIELISPSIILKLHCMDMKDLRKAYRDNEKQINALLSQYSLRYTTKANKTIYDLMVIALKAELQNTLYNLKYEKLDKSIESIKEITQKYTKITCEGNQNIAGTLTKFIGEIEYLFINAVKIEYNYYVKKEQAKQEQLAIKEQMRQEVEERKALAAEKAKIEKEEEKYHKELSKLNEQLSIASDAETTALRQRILELQTQLSNVTVKKEEITKLQNGKAGNIYIISNLGSFGENIFKIGMTRRQDPQDRINELSNASVPFKFDVHSFIFSDDAVDLENKLHKTLNDKRVNKVNIRKEFFRISIDELEQIVNSIDPTAEFNRTMVAEEFHQSQSSNHLYTSEYTPEFDEEEE